MIAHANVYSGIRAGRKLHYGRVVKPRNLKPVWRIATLVPQRRDQRFTSQTSTSTLGERKAARRTFRVAFRN